MHFAPCRPRITQGRERACNDDAVKLGIAVRRCVKQRASAEGVAEQAVAAGSRKGLQERINRRDAILVHIVDRSGRAAFAVSGIIEHERGDALAVQELLDANPICDGLVTAVKDEKGRRGLAGCFCSHQETVELAAAAWDRNALETQADVRRRRLRQFRRIERQALWLTASPGPSEESTPTAEVSSPSSHDIACDPGRPLDRTIRLDGSIRSVQY